MSSWPGIFLFGSFFLLLLLASPGVCPPQVLLRVLVILCSCYLSIQLFYYVLSLPIFYSKIVFFPLHPVVSMSSYILYLLFSRIFLRYLLHRFSIPFKSPVFRQYLFSLLVSLSDLSLFSFVFSYHHIVTCFFLPWQFRSWSELLYPPF